MTTVLLNHVVRVCCSFVVVFFFFFFFFFFLYVKSELLVLYTDQWLADDAEYDSDAYVSQVACKYSRASSTLSAGLSSVGVSIATGAATAASAREQRYLQLIHGELAGINGSLRMIANVIAGGGSRAKVKESLQNLLNTNADDSESDVDLTITKSLLGRKRSAASPQPSPNKRGRHKKELSTSTSAVTAAAGSVLADDSDCDDNGPAAADEDDDEPSTQAPTQPLPSSLQKEMSAHRAPSAASAAAAAAPSKKAVPSSRGKHGTLGTSKRK
jgi:hypothetical protein